MKHNKSPLGTQKAASIGSNVMQNASMIRVTMLATWFMRIMWLILLMAIAFSAYYDPEARFFCLIGFCALIFALFSSKGWILFSLSSIYLNDEIIRIKKSWFRKKEISIGNAISIEYQTIGQQLIGKFWFYDDTTGDKQFVYFWPTMAETDTISGKLHLACIMANDLRNENTA